MKYLLVLKLIFLFIPRMKCGTVSTSDIQVATKLIENMQSPKHIVITSCLPLSKQRVLSKSQDMRQISLLCGKQVQLAKDLQQNSTPNIQTKFLEPTEWAKMENRSYHSIFLVDISCKIVAQSLIESVPSYFLRDPYKWILTGLSNVTTDKLTEALSQMDIFIDSDVTLIVRNADDGFKLLKIYKQATGRSMIYENVGSWTNGQLVMFNNASSTLALRRRNLGGADIPTSFVFEHNETEELMAIYKNDYSKYTYKDIHLDAFPKSNYPLFLHLVDFVNGTGVQYVEDYWGYYTNGSWNGMSALLFNKITEFGGTVMFITKPRLPFVEFTACPSGTNQKFIFRPPKLSYTNNLFILPFNDTVWYSAVALSAIMMLVLFLVAYWEHKNKEMAQVEMSSDPGTFKASVSDVLFYVLGAACQQASPAEFKGFLGRMVMMTLLLAFMFLSTSYSANIVALLQSSSTSIRTLEDLSNSRMKLGVEENAYSRHYFSIATEPVRRKIYTQQIAPPGRKSAFMKMDEGLRKMQKGLFAFHCDTKVGYRVISKLFLEEEKCGLVEIGFLDQFSACIPIRRGSPYKELIKIGYLRMIEAGLNVRNELYYLSNKPRCSGPVGSFISVSMVDFYPAILILIYGFICSILLLAIEWAVYSREYIIKSFLSRQKI